MQVNYKTISSFEFDALSGTYKKVNKEVEDTSASSVDFESLLSAGGEAEKNTDLLSKISNGINNLSANNPSQGVFDNMSSNIFAYKFRQNESELIKAAETKANNEKGDTNAIGDLLSQI